MNQIIAIVGPTAAGKSSLAMELAHRIDAEIISVDSMQVYRGMDIGTAKPTITQQQEIRHHLIDIADPSEEVTVADHQMAGRAVIAGSSDRLIVTGGSGLHFRALVDPMSFAPTDRTLRETLEATDVDLLVGELIELDPGAGTRIDLSNRRRVVRAVEVARLGAGTPSERFDSEQARRFRDYEPEIPFLGFGVDPGTLIGSRVANRLAMMRTFGLVEEVYRLAPVLGRTARGAIGYRELLGTISGEKNLDDALDEIEANTLQLVRRQRTWFRRDPRLRWIPWSENPIEMADHIEGALI